MGRTFRVIIHLLVPLAILGVISTWIFRFEISCLRYRHVINPAADRYQVPRRLLAALAWQESRFQPYRRGQAGEIGLIQILPASGREWARAEKVQGFCQADLVDPATNVLAGAWYLSRALNRWKDAPDPVPFALAEYNAGPSNVLRWRRAAMESSKEFQEAITYPGTRRYVKNILMYYETFGRPWKRW